MKLKELRKENKKTQEEIAKYLNLTQASYGRYETGIHEPTIDTLCKLADFYSVSLDYLVGREFNNKYGYLGDQEIMLLNVFAKLNDKNKLKLVAEATGMLIAQE